MTRFFNSFRIYIITRRRDLALAFIVALAVWLPRGIDIDRFVTIDEPPWLYRSANFYYAMTHGDYDRTSPDIRYSDGVQVLAPGIVTMWAETFAFLIEFPEYRGFGQGLLEDPSQFEKLLDTHGVKSLDILTTGRHILTIWNVVVLVTAFFIARRLFGLWVALLGFMFIAYEPYYIALTKIAHLDGPLAGVMLLSILAYLAYIYDGRETKYLLISGVAAGFSWLTKLPGLLLIPAVGLLTAHLIVIRWRIQTVDQKKRFNSWVKRLIGHQLLWGLVALGILTLFWPEMWVDPIGTITASIRRVSRHTRGGAEEIFGSAPGENKYLIDWSFATSYIRWYFWRSTPVILFGLIAAGVAYFRRIAFFEQQKLRRMVAGLVVYSIVFFLAVAYTSTKANRYLIPIYLPMDLIAATGWVAVAIWLKDKFVQPARKYVLPAVFAAAVIVQIFLAVRTHPYYFTYFNPLLGGSKTAGEVIPRGIGLGEGLDAAASYLNAKKESQDIKVMSWYHVGPFSYYFSGITRGISSVNEFPKERLVAISRVDYLVTYVNQWKRRIPEKLFDALDSITPEHVIWINEIEYVRIYKVSDFPPSFYEYLQDEGS